MISRWNSLASVYLGGTSICSTSGSRPVEDIGCANILHLHTTPLLLGRQRCGSLVSARSKPLVAFFVSLLEMKISWRTWALQYGYPVFQNRALGEGPVSVFLEKLVGVQVLARRLTPTN